jgi:hypothetical protein
MSPYIHNSFIYVNGPYSCSYFFFISERKKKKQKTKLNHIKYVRPSCTAWQSFKVLPLEGSKFLTAENVTPINIHQQVTADREECVDINAIGHQTAHVHDVQPEQIFQKVSDKQQAINRNRKGSAQSCWWTSSKTPCFSAGTSRHNKHFTQATAGNNWRSVLLKNVYVMGATSAHFQTGTEAGGHYSTVSSPLWTWKQ